MTLFAFVLMILTTHLPEVDAHARTEVADAIASAVEQVDGSPRLAAELAELAVVESRLAPWVLDGRCNDAAWRASPEGKKTMRRAGGTCDSGAAVGAWQGRTDDTARPGPGWTREALLNPHEAALLVAHEWSLHPSRWTRYREVRIQAARWPETRALQKE